MATLYNADLKPLEPGTPTRPYEHANKLFLADNFRLAPKQSFLYYVCINIDTGVLTGASILQSLITPDGTSSQTLIEQYEAGLLAKRVDLPKFTLSTKTLNAYNRKNIIQTGITYDPVRITFHDDAADVITNFWNDYYTYYYRDSDYNNTLYQLPHKYQPRNREGWGFTPRNNSLKPFLRNIQIFSLHNKRFTEYTLINPFITSWRHGEHDSSQGSGIMENEMTVAFETVKYRTGYVNPVDVNGFSVIHYDNEPSPISNSITNIYTDSGLIGALATGPKDLARPNGTGSGTGVLGNILNAYRFYNTAKNINIGQIAQATLGQIAGQVINGAVNSAINTVFFPTVNGTAGYGGTYGSTQVYNQAGVIGANPYATPNLSIGATIASSAIANVQGAVIQNTTRAVDEWIRGLMTRQTGPVATPANSAVYQVQTTNGIIQVNAQGVPVTGQTTAYVFDNNNGAILAEIQATQTASGTYNPNNINENVQYVTSSVDENGNKYSELVYKDGTRVIRNDEVNTITQIYPGTNYGKPQTTIFAPTDAAVKAASGQPLTGPQFYTDPRTGIVYTTGGTLSAQVTNTITGTAGLAAGAYIGTGINQALNGTFLGKTVIGQTVSGAISGAIALETGKIVNNGLQPIVNGVTKTISQGFDSVLGSIKNVTGSWFGSGKYSEANPTQNIVSRMPDGEGGFIVTDKTGSVFFTDQNGKVMGLGPQTQSSGWSWPSFGSTTPGLNTDTNATFSGQEGIWTDGYGNPIRSGYTDTIGAGFAGYGPAVPGSVFTEQGYINSSNDGLFNGPEFGNSENPLTYSGDGFSLYSGTAETIPEVTPEAFDLYSGPDPWE